MTLLLCLILLPGTSSAENLDTSPQNQIHWSLHMPDTPLQFQGMNNHDGISPAMGSGVYTAPNMASAVTFMVIHAMHVESANKEQIKKQQQEADKVIEPYQATLEEINHPALAEGLLNASAFGSTGKIDTAPNEEDFIVESLPIFFMSQDQRAIILDNLLVIQKPGEPKESAYKNKIRVVLTPHGAEDPVTFWTENNGARLKQASTRLLAESIDIGLTHANTPPPEDAPSKTVRYLEGSTQKMERAQILQSNCGRLLIKTLRGTLMSVPAITPQQSENKCRPVAVAS